MNTEKKHTTNFRTAWIAIAATAWIAIIAAWVVFITGCATTGTQIQNPPPAVQFVEGAK